MMSENHCVVLSTVANEEAGESIIEALLQNRLAACVQTIPLTSHYRWKGELRKESEILVMIKTRKSLYDEVERMIRSGHDYDCPEIVQLPISAGLAEYLAWIDEECA